MAEDLLPANGQLVETSMERMHVSTWGDRQDPAIVMTHGMAAWGGLWEQTAEGLSAAGYYVIAVDLPPFGFSDRADTNFSRSHQAKRLHALVEALGLKSYTFIGHSYGGGVSLEAALRFPQGMQRLILICPVVNLLQPGETATVKPVPWPLRSNMVAETLVAATVANPLLTGVLTRSFMHNTSALTARHIEILQRPMTRQGNSENMVLWLQQFFANDPLAISRSPQALKQLQVPVSLVWGEQDTVTPIQQGEALAALLHPSAFRRLANTGHMPQLESPDILQSTLLELLSAPAVKTP